MLDICVVYHVSDSCCYNYVQQRMQRLRLLNVKAIERTYTNEAKTETVPPPTGRDTDGDGIILPITPYTPRPPLPPSP